MLLYAIQVDFFFSYEVLAAPANVWLVSFLPYKSSVIHRPMATRNIHIFHWFGYVIHPPLSIFTGIENNKEIHLNGLMHYVKELKTLSLHDSITY